MTFPISIATPIRFEAALPKKVDVVVIGGGVIGVSAALFLARAGQSVALLEKGRIAGEQSSRNWGWIRAQGRDPAEIPIMLEARRHWAAFDQEIPDGVGLATCGVLYLTDQDRVLSAYADWLTSAQPYDLDSHVLTSDQLADLMPNAQANWRGGLYTPSDMRAEPWVAVPKLAALAEASGATILESCAVRGLETSGGAVSSVVTEQGEIETSRVILAGGAWSRLFLRRHGVALPQLSVRSSVLATGPLPEVTGISAVDGNMSLRRRSDGGYTLTPSGFSELFVGPDAFGSLRQWLPLLRKGGFEYQVRPTAPKGFPDAWGTPRHWQSDEITPFERMRILNPAPNHRALQRAVQRFEATFPSVGKVVAQAKWAGMIDAMPDVVPVVDRISDLPGVTVATGMSGHGFGIGPAFGRIAAALATDEPVGHDLSRFRFDRFRDGSPFLPGPTI